MGSDAHYAEEAPGHRVTVDGFWIDARQVTNREFARFVRETGYVTVAERPLDPADVPGRAGREPRARVARVHRDAGAGRPAPHRPVVDVDARRLLAAPGGRRRRRSRGAPITPSSMSPTRTPPATPPGRARRCRARRSGSSRPAAGSTARPTSGATSRSRPARGWRTTGTASSPGAPEPGYGTHRARRLVRAQRPRPVRHGGQRLGVDGGLVLAPATPRLRPRRAASRATPGAGRRAPASTRPSRSSRSRARSSRAARSSAPTPTACATGPRRDGRR